MLKQTSAVFTGQLLALWLHVRIVCGMHQLALECDTRCCLFVADANSATIADDAHYLSSAEY